MSSRSAGASARSPRVERLGLCLVVSLIALGTGGCDILETTDDPTTIGASDIAEAFQPRFVGTASDFANALDDAVVYEALFADELVWGGSFVNRQQIDVRAIETDNDIVAQEPWTTLQVSTRSAKNLQQDLLDGRFPEQFQNASESAEFARISLWAAYSKLYIAQLFCTAAFNNSGPELSSQEVYGQAVEDFTQALEASNAPPAVRNAALVGRARARLQMGNREDAAADAARVTEGFNYLVQYTGSVDRQENDVWDFTWQQARMSVAEKFRDPTIDDTDTPDPRVEVFDTGETSFAGSVLQFNPLKYSERASSIRLASWEEAQYIVALVSGGQTAIDIMNEIRERNGIEKDVPLTPDADEMTIRLKVVEERSRTLFLEGQRMADMRRMEAQFGVNLFPSGPDFGDQTCMPLPDLERDNNPGI